MTRRPRILASTVLSSAVAVGLMTVAVGTQGRPVPTADDGQRHPTLRRLSLQELTAAIDRLEQWIAAVRAHEIGTADAHATIVASWSAYHLAQMFPLLETMLATVQENAEEAAKPPAPAIRLPVSDPQDPTAHLVSAQLDRLHALATPSRVTADRNGLLHRGARLHADVAIHVKPTSFAFQPLDQRGRAVSVTRFGSSGERVVVAGPDGNYRGMQYGLVHWDFARLLLSAVSPNPSSDPWSRLWYRATAAYLIKQGEFGEAKPHFADAARFFPDDMWLTFGAATMHAAMASPPVQDFVRLTRLPGNVRFDVDDRGAHLRRAEELFRRVVSMDPGLIEAQIRLARVRLDLREPAEAMQLLEAALPKTNDAVLSYYGLLFLGHAHRELRRLEPARTAFLAAATLFPRAQTPRLALSELTRGMSRTEARAALDPLLALGPKLSEREDPWWQYHHGDGRHMEGLFAQLDRGIAER
jgi:tetratricopeptide (TPR) repeat protein